MKMSNAGVVFVRTRHMYASYDVYWSLVELGGFETCYVDEIDFDRDATYIITPINGEVSGHLSNHRTHRARLIWWVLERFDGPGMREHTPESIVDEAHGYGFDRFWTSCRAVQKLDPRLEHVIFGSDARLAEHYRNGEDYDFTHQSYAWGRRMILYRNMISLGLREGPASWGPARVRVLATSKVLVNAHQYDMPVYAPLRFALGAAYHLPVVSEWIEDPYPLTGVIDTVTYDALPGRVFDIARRMHPDIRRAMGDLLHYKLCVEHSFAESVLRSV